MKRDSLPLMDSHWRRNLAILGGAYIGVAVVHLIIEAVLMRPGVPFDDRVSLVFARQILVPLLWLTGIVLLPMVLIPVGLVRLAFPSTAGRVPALGLLTIVGTGAYLLLLSSTWGNEIRRDGLRAFAMRAEPVVKAIHAYERDHGRPPPSLLSLVPEYIASSSLGQFRLRACRTAHFRVYTLDVRASGPRWEIVFECPQPGMTTLDHLHYASNAETAPQLARPSHDYFLGWRYVWD